MNKIPMTCNGSEFLKAELERLKSVDRPRVIAAIAEARAHGDLKENAEYHAAKDQQGFIEARIKELEYKLSNAQVIDVTQVKNSGRVVFGATVTLINTDTEENVVYKIVGEDEADISQAKLSITSPIARALIGKEVDDSVEVVTPNGLVHYDVDSVAYV